VELQKDLPDGSISAPAVDMRSPASNVPDEGQCDSNII